MLKCEKCKNENGHRICRYDEIGTPREDQEIIDHSEVKKGLLELIKDSFRRSEDSSWVANVSAALLGDFGMGKTAMINYFIDKINGQSYDEVLVDLADDYEEQELDHFNYQDMNQCVGVAFRVDAREIVDRLQENRLSDCISPLFFNLRDAMGIGREYGSVAEITEAVLKAKNASRLFLFIDEMEALKHKRYGIDFEEFFTRFTDDLRTFINGEGRYNVKNRVTVVLYTVPNVWEEFQRKEDIAGGLLTREYKEPFRLQRFDLNKALLFVDRNCKGFDNSPFSHNCVCTLHIVSGGMPRLLTKLCKHIEGNLPADPERTSDSYELRERVIRSLCGVVGEDPQITYAFDRNAYQAMYDEIRQRHTEQHAKIFSLLVAEYGEYADEQVAETFGMDVTEVESILEDLSDDERLILGIRPLSKGELFDHSTFSSSDIPKDLVEKGYLRKKDLEEMRSVGKTKIFGKLDYLEDVLGKIKVVRWKADSQYFVSRHADDLTILWNIAEEQAGQLGNALRACTPYPGEWRYRLSEGVRNRVFPVASQADLPFLSKEAYYELRNVVSGLDREQRIKALLTGVMKVCEHAGLTREGERKPDHFDFKVPLEDLFPNFNDDLDLIGRAVIVDSAEEFQESALAEKSSECGFVLAICTKNFGGNKLIELQETSDAWLPMCPVVVRLIGNTQYIRSC